MSGPGIDPIEAFYDRHPYPPPVADLGAAVSRGSDPTDRLVEHHLIWPKRPVTDGLRVLVAGCGTSQAPRHAALRPDAQVVGIDVSATSVEHSRRLIAHHELANASIHQLPIERVGDLGREFDHIVCTGVLHHLDDPVVGLLALRNVLAAGGAITLMVYAPYGRTGIYLIQDYCRRLGLTTDAGDVADLVATLREVPLDHPISRLLRETRDFRDDDALADALLNPRDRAYSVPDLFELLAAADLRFGRWHRQAPYLPDGGSISETPHAARIGELEPEHQYAVLELFRGTMLRHTLIAYAADDPDGGRVDFGSPRVGHWRPIRVPTVAVVEERLPAGAAAALLNRAHTDTDLVMFVDRDERDAFGRIDGISTIGELDLDVGFVRRLYRHDLVVVDATGSPT
jgi:SAM-dependent methyltransferase